MAKDRVIGKDNQMPWHLPADLRHFKAVTMGKPVVMGRKTYESIGRPLPGRHNIVISRQSDLVLDGVTVVADIEAAVAAAGSVDELMIIGGGQLYGTLLERADRLYLTLVDLAVEGDTQFPDYQQLPWNEIAREHRLADERNPYAMDFITLERVMG
ncbi:type 3 dihydrofolate reductase [Ferrimonas pelagia]|uniref:Dihydrofolate reductase n=2 Tax=Ferrimonas pelagia TaxID=1177826 RepID=A0ABP9ESK0_9GAMM